jgi:hypothetical protein
VISAYGRSLTVIVFQLGWAATGWHYTKPIAFARQQELQCRLTEGMTDARNAARTNAHQTNDPENLK